MRNDIHWRPGRQLTAMSVVSGAAAAAADSAIASTDSNVAIASSTLDFGPITLRLLSSEDSQRTRASLGLRVQRGSMGSTIEMEGAQASNPLGSSARGFRGWGRGAVDPAARGG